MPKPVALLAPRAPDSPFAGHHESFTLGLEVSTSGLLAIPALALASSDSACFRAFCKMFLSCSQDSLSSS